MNDYQKIYNELGNEMLYQDEHRTVYVEHLKSYGDLKELIDKSIPTKAIESTKYDSFCPNEQCKAWLRNVKNYCPNCGQRLLDKER